MNELLGHKVSIVTAKPQTTRQRVLGIYNDDSAQIIFLDTPGLIAPQYLLHRRMLSHAASAVADADIIMVMTEADAGTKLSSEVEDLIGTLQGSKPVFLIINKADTIYKPQLLPIMAAFVGRGQFAEVIPVSALKRQNLDDLLKTIIRTLPEQPAFYPTDIISEHPERFFVAEFIREAVFEQFREEVPYSTAVEIRDYREREAGAAYIAADIVVERESQKGILIGRHGAALKTVGEVSRRQIEAFISRRVFLELRVKVREGWRQDERALNNLGYAEE
jgi:GTP-binding protein Era